MLAALLGKATRLHRRLLGAHQQWRRSLHGRPGRSHGQRRLGIREQRLRCHRRRGQGGAAAGGRRRTGHPAGGHRCAGAEPSQGLTFVAMACLSRNAPGESGGRTCSSFSMGLRPRRRRRPLRGGAVSPVVLAQRFGGHPRGRGRRPLLQLQLMPARPKALRGNLRAWGQQALWQLRLRWQIVPAVLRLCLLEQVLQVLPPLPVLQPLGVCCNRRLLSGGRRRPQHRRAAARWSWLFAVSHVSESWRCGVPVRGLGSSKERTMHRGHEMRRLRGCHRARQRVRRSWDGGCEDSCNHVSLRGRRRAGARGLRNRRHARRRLVCSSWQALGRGGQAHGARSETVCAGKSGCTVGSRCSSQPRRNEGLSIRIQRDRYVELAVAISDLLPAQREATDALDRDLIAESIAPRGRVLVLW